ncbi:MAG TPA: hypothetical protein VFM46_08715, partial [Pseudomonadales bacterium]|nr:hypothetical protein [Pseudomonadales bacterium]
YTLIGPAPVFSPAWLFGVGGILLFSLIFLKTDFPAKPFWIIGLLLCALPACAGSGGSRVAMFMNLALAPMVSSVIFHGLAVRNTAQRLYSWLLILFKILMLPLTLMAPIILNRFDVIYVITAAKTLPIETNDRQRTLLMLNPVSEPASRLFKIVRLWHNLPVTESQFSFASGTSSIAISRPDDKSLILTPADGFAGSQGEQFMRDIAAHPFKAGDTLSFAQVTIRVLETTADGRPASVRFEFDAELENNKFIWLQCDNERLIAWKPIAIGEHATLAACKAN